MPPIVSIVGQSESGKTTLIEKLIPLLTQRGYRIGTIKHTHHAVDIDRSSKDSARHRTAGAETVMLASPGRIAMFKATASESLDGLIRYFETTFIMGDSQISHRCIPVVRVESRAPADAHPGNLVPPAPRTARL